MFYIIKNVVKNIKHFNDVKTILILKENILKEKNLVDEYKFSNSLSHIFFNGTPIFLENNKKENTLLFNKVRNDKKYRKRGFQKRGYWKKMHYFIRKNNMMCYAFKVQNIDYEKIKKLKRGEIYSN
ncbi:conserved Plasmodium protein, unknown function [Plasmodium gallinaceum]|uniref:Uncharacterized protein n=1 Tax=Plasmodium gallinaceum TaxID=5849 RepID=A0A1J1H018_PLAGA|nr:conserved Plasmodium protein, unknown function [Plasmodium gallinaceum]CRG97897.1 conserved Plasmodium protein, unknown function [Plasmodium gallinaceum]